MADYGGKVQGGFGVKIICEYEWYCQFEGSGDTMCLI